MSSEGRHHFIQMNRSRSFASANQHRKPNCPVGEDLKYLLERTAKVLLIYRLLNQLLRLILVDLSLSQNLPLQRTTTLEQRYTTINLTEIHKYLTKKRPSFLQPTKRTMATTGSPFLAESTSKSIIINLCFA